MNRPRVLISDPLAEDGVNRLAEECEVTVRTKLPEDELAALIGDFDALVVRSETKVTERVLAAATNLKVVGRAGVGIDNIDVKAATERGVLVVNAPRGNIIAAAELAIGLLFALARNIPQADASIRRGEWQRSKYTGVEVRDKTLGVVGLGNIGSEVAKRAQGLEMEVIAFDPVVSTERAEQFNVQLVGLDELFQRSDFVTIHTPLVEGTRNLVNERLLRLSKPGLRLINAARGGIVDEEALAKALTEGWIAGAALDVFLREPLTGSPLLEAPNLIVTPHIGASTVEAQKSVAADVAEEVLAVLSGGAPRHAVNAPALAPEELAFVRPFVDLAELMADLHVQLEGGRLSSLEVQCEGELASHDLSLVVAGAVKGLYQRFTEERVTPVNARLVAAQRSLKITERKSASVGAKGYPNAVTLKVDGSEIEGSVLLGEPRITRVGPFRLDLIPSGRFLVSRHRDRPGVVAHIGGVLGAHDVNIASMQLGREAPRGRAMMFIAVDDVVSEPVLEELRRFDGLEDIRYVELGADG